MKKTLLLPTLALLASLAAAAPPARLLSDYTHSAWTRLQGAPSDVVKFAQTTDGWLWISSPGGLTRFDGVRFERVETLAGHRLQSASTMGLLATRDGGLWIGHRFGGITALVRGQVREFGAEQGLPTSGVWSLTEGPDGSIWACVGGGLAVLAPGAARFAVVTPDSGLPAGGARQVLFSRSGRQWVSVQGGVYWRDGGGRFRRAWPFLDLMSLAEGPDGTIWATDGQQHGYRLLPEAPPGNPAPRPALAANGIHFDRNGTMWLLKGDALERGPGQAGGDASQQLRRENGISGPLPQTWFEDREGNIWVGTASGLDRLRRNRLRLLATPQPLDHPAMLADSDGQVLIGNQAGGVHRFSSEGAPLQLEGKLMTAGYRAPDGALWFGNDKERWRKAPSGLLSWYPHPPEYAQHDVQAMTLDHSGRMWLSLARHGLFSSDGRQWRKDGGVAGLPQGLVPAVATDARGRIWAGYLRSRIAMIEQGKARVFGEADGVQVGNVLSLLADGERVWAGGEYGVAWYDGRAFHMLEAPLRGISGMARTAQGELWLHGSEGITRIAAPEVERLLREGGAGGQGSQPVHYERFDAQDGLLGGAEQFRPLPSLVQASDGKLWFSTASDVASIDPARITRNPLAPPVQIRALRSGGVSYMPLPQVRLPEGSRDVEIAFTALSLSMPERMRFSYMLEGVDSGWRDVQGRREAFYTNLAPGQYRFRVLASNEDGIWNAEGATLQLEIPPTFTQTPWFIALLVLGGAVLLAAAYALRVRRLTARLQDLQQERLAERARIARGLHDTLLQSVQSLIMFFDRQAARLAPGSEEKAKVEQTLELADQLMAEGRNYILDLRSDGSADALAQALRQYGAVLLNERFHASSNGQARAMPPRVQEEVLSIAREALFNAARHAHATRVELLLDYGASFFLLEVRDDGCGLGSARAPGPGRLGHYGLVGMRERAAALGATCSISSPAEGGTVVRLQLAAQLAFVERRHAGWQARMRRWLPGASSK